MGKMVISAGALKGQNAAQNKKMKIISVVRHISGTVWSYLLVLLFKMISPGFYFIFSKLWFFWVVSGVKEQKMAQNNKKFAVIVHISGNIHYMICIYGTHV